MKKLIILLAITMSDGVVAAGSVGWTKITTLAVQNNDLMIYTELKVNPNECERDNAVILKKSDPSFDLAYSMILATFMAGKEIKAFSDGCHIFDEKTYNYIRGFKYLQVR